VTPKEDGTPRFHSKGVIHSLHLEEKKKEEEEEEERYVERHRSQPGGTSNGHH
jgi:hypothetical protein